MPIVKHSIVLFECWTNLISGLVYSIPTLHNKHCPRQNYRWQIWFDSNIQNTERKQHIEHESKIGQTNRYVNKLNSTCMPRSTLKFHKVKMYGRNRQLFNEILRICLFTCPKCAVAPCVQEGIAASWKNMLNAVCKKIHHYFKTDYTCPS